MSEIPFPTLEQVEREHIQAALRFFRYKKTETARALGISPSTLFRKIDEYKLESNSGGDGRTRSMYAWERDR